MGVRFRDWAVAVSLAAAFGVLLGGVYSGVAGWQGPAGRMAAVTASGTTGTSGATAGGAGLPVPNERPSPAAAPKSATVRTAPVWTVQRGSDDETAAAKHKPEKESREREKGDHRDHDGDHDRDGSDRQGG